MALTFVQRWNVVSTSDDNLPRSATASISVTVGHLVAVLVGAFSNAPHELVNTTISDDGFNSWEGSNSNAVSPGFPGAGTGDFITWNLFWSVITAVPGGGLLEITVAPASPVDNTFLAFEASEWSGGGSIFSLSSAGVGVGGSGGTPAAGNVPVLGSDLVFGAFAQISVGSTLWTPGAGYTAGLNTMTGSNPISYLIEYLANTTTNPATPTATMAGLGLWVAAGFALTPNAPAVMSGFITKSGTLAMFMCNATAGLSNGNYPLGYIQGVNATPTFKVNGVSASFGPVVWMDATHDGSQVACRVQCGGVRSLVMSNAGENYTAPTVAWNGDGGGSGHTIGAPVLALGVTSYTITNAGSGLTDGSFYWPPTGAGQSGYPPVAWLTVSGGSVTSVVPASASPVNIGGGCSVGFPSAYGNATIQCNVSNYISGIPVINPGTGFTSLPTYTITDSTGSGGVVSPSMALAATDVVTYSVADFWLTTDLGPILGATNASIPNFTGVLEGATGNCSGMRDTPTTHYGGEHAGEGQQTSYSVVYKNKMSTALPFAGAGVTLDADYQPVSWTPGGTITCSWGGNAYGIAKIAAGIYTVQYDDPQTDTTTVSLNTPDFTFIGQTRVGTVVTQQWLWNIVQPPFADGKLLITSSSGTMQISVPWVFAPGNTIDRSNKYAVDDAFVANFTNPNGTGPSLFRSMAEDTIYLNNMVDASDLPATNLFNGLFLPNSTQPTIFNTVAARFLNTNPAKSSTGDNTYPWPASTKLYSSQPWANSGTDGFGNYLDMTAGPLGVNDNGNIFGFNPGANGDHGVVEFRTSSPHGLKTGQSPLLVSNTAKALPWVNGGTTGGTTTIPSGGYSTLFVTGPNLYVMLIGSTPHNANPLVDKINSTAEIPLIPGDVEIQLGVPTGGPTGSGFVPYEYQAELNKRFPNSNMWINFPVTASHGFVTEVANRVVAHLGMTNGLIFEIGDEHWNFGPPYAINYFYLKQMTNFSQFAAPGQPYLTYATGGITMSQQNGIATPINTLLSADLFNVFKTVWVAAGRDPTKLVLAYGGWWQSATTAAAIASTVLAFGLPQTNAIATVAPYTDIEPNQTTINQAYFDAGSPVVTTPGYWPVDAINDFERHINFYNRLFWGFWSSTYAALAGTSLRLSCYEGALDTLMDRLQGGFRSMAGAGIVTSFDVLQEDCMNHSSWADRIYAYLLAQQRGNPLVANSGATYGSYLNLWALVQIGGNSVWRIQFSPSMTADYGLSNSFMTPQGGFNGSNLAGTGNTTYGFSQINQGPGFKGLLNFNALANLPVTPVVPVSFPQPAAVLVGL